MSAAAERLDMAEARIALLDQRITFMVNALSAVLEQYGIDPTRAQQAKEKPGAVLPLAEIKGGGMRSAPRRPRLHLVPEEER